MQQEYERLKLEKLSAAKQQAMLEESVNGVGGYSNGSSDTELPPNYPASLRREDLLSDFNILKVRRERLDSQMEKLESHNKQLQDQLLKLRTILGIEHNTLPLTGFALEKPLPPSGSSAAAAAAAAAATTSILKSSGATNMNRSAVGGKSIHFSKNNMILDDLR